MRYKTLFRVMLKALGVWSFIQGAIDVLPLMQTVLLSMLLDARFPINSGMWSMILTPLLPSAAHMAIGAYLFFGGRWVADKAIPNNRPYCHECGYDLTGAVGNVCAECGTPFRSA